MRFNANNDTTPFYPASYELPNIISVAASDAADTRAGFSNYGAATVDLAAPGVQILSTVKSSDSSYGNLSALAPNASVNVQFVLGVQQGGGFRFLVNVEALP